MKGKMKRNNAVCISQKISSFSAGRALILAASLSASLGIAALVGDAGDLDKAVSIQNAFNDVAEKAFPCVVVISTKKELENTGPAPFFEHFFDRYRKNREKGKKEPKPNPYVEAKGSGFLISADGYIVTNNHVVSEMDEIIVRTKDRKEYKVEVKGTDPKTDLALLKIEGTEKFPFLEFANSDSVKVGDWAIAIGAPYNLDYTMTVGIVSQTGRSVGLNAYENYIQTDASINRGNSGGPLLNIEGKVVGVNDVIFTSGASEGNIGLGFAIPSNMASDVVEQLKSKGEVTRPWIGIAMEALDPETKEQFNAENGILVREVMAQSPADKGGIEPGDIILSIDGKALETPRDLQFEVAGKKPGKAVLFKILRNGKEMELEIIPELQNPDGMEIGGLSNGADKVLGKLGLRIEEKDGALSITEILPGSGAEASGLKPGMKILAVNKVKVSNREDLLKAIDKKKGKPILFDVSDGRRKLFVVLKIQ